MPTCPKILLEIVKTLFPQQMETKRIINVNNEIIPPITEEEIINLSKSLKNGKAPGLDGIPNIAIKTAMQTMPKMFADVYNACLNEGIFPDQWKKQKLVLIPKGNKNVQEPS